MVLGKSIQIAVSIQVKNSRGQTILPLIEITLQVANLRVRLHRVIQG